MANSAKYEISDEYREKWSYLCSYREKKVRLVMLCEKRDELRDLKRIADDIGMPPKNALPGDPTGNTAARLVDTLENVSKEIEKTLNALQEVTDYIDSARGEADRCILTMKFVRGKSNDEIAQFVQERTGRQTTRASVKKRIYRIIYYMETHK